MSSRKAPVAVISGCSSGIGEQLALSFASSGFTVFATTRRVESLDHLTSRHDNIKAVSLELSDPRSMERLRDTMAECTGGRLDVLVNNAGTHYAATGMDLEMEEVMNLFQVNVFAVMRLCQLFVPLLRNSDRGTIVQIGSVARDVPVVWQGAYNASKAALSQYTKTLRLVSSWAGFSEIPGKLCDLAVPSPLSRQVMNEGKIVVDKYHPRNGPWRSFHLWPVEHKDEVARD